MNPDQTLSFLVAGLAVGAKVPIEIIRDGKRQLLTATLGERPSEDKLASIGKGDGGDKGLDPESDQSNAKATRESLGLAFQPLTAEISRQLGLNGVVKGLVVGAVDPSSDAAAKGMQRGDVILSVNYKPANTVADISAAATAAKAAGRANVLLLFQRGNTPPRYIAVKLKQG